MDPAKTPASLTTSSLTTCTKWSGWSTRKQTFMPHISPESRRYAENTQLRPTDVVVVSFPKTGTTFTQTLCEMLRTSGDTGFDHFDDITEVQPWIDFAYDLGQDLNDEQSYFPRIFKSHQLLSAVNPGAKYLTIVRDPAATLLSWFAFQKAKGRPGYAEHADANEFVSKNSDRFSTNLIFGTNLWEFYAEMWCARHDPAVLTLVYEGLVADGPDYSYHLPLIADFIDVPHAHKNEETYQTVASLVSRQNMLKHVDKFDDHFIAQRGAELGRATRIMEPAPKVRRGSAGLKTELTVDTLEWLEDQWLEKVTPVTGHATYDEYAEAIAERLVEEEDVFEEEVENVVVQRTKSILRRRSSVSVLQMPQLRRRRESLAPHE